jgi:hypothetical protein
MTQACLFWLLTIVITVLLSSKSVSVFSSSTENNTVLEQAEKSLAANQKQSAIVSPEPVPNEIQSAFQEITGSSMVEDVSFTWVIISSGTEISINLRYEGDGSTPSVSVAANALAKSADGNPVTMKGNSVLDAGWASPYSLNIPMNGESTLYDSTSVNVVASPLGSSPSPPSPATETDDNKITSPPVKPPQVGVLKVLSSNSFMDSAGYLHLVGEIENGTPDPVTLVQATATFYDKNNNVVATDYSYTNPSDLRPGNKAPFEIILTSASIPVNRIDHHTITASSNE